MKVPLLDLCPQYQSLKKEILEAIAEVCESQRFILGAKVEQLEAERNSLNRQLLEIRSGNARKKGSHEE